ncbi:hypothetical protein B0T10DRAFT_568584 [Thelonectria olida]|uniref:Chromo domain-containing protein n=1 Tax=Thelonectria olida TaxID=1576542 RepID=A0A9P8VQ43_9HYPO|nr:hypothetical protein B0T10DRAFT_568584 [Thelonectria olida]
MSAESDASQPFDEAGLSLASLYPELSESGAESGSQKATATTQTEEDTCSQEWEIDQILDETFVDGTRHYLVSWTPSLVAEHDAQNARELIAEWELLKAVRKEHPKKRMSLRSGIRKRVAPTRVRASPSRTEW